MRRDLIIIFASVSIVALVLSLLPIGLISLTFANDPTFPIGFYVFMMSVGYLWTSEIIPTYFPFIIILFSATQLSAAILGLTGSRSNNPAVLICGSIFSGLSSLICIADIFFIIYFYRRESVPWGVIVAAIRLAIFGAILVLASMKAKETMRRKKEGRYEKLDQLYVNAM